MAATVKEHINEGHDATSEYDAFYISPDQKKEYGIKDNEEPYWARDPRFWVQHEQKDRVEELKRDPRRGGMGARLVTNSDHDMISIGSSNGAKGSDLVLMAIPKENTERQQAEIDAGSREFEDGLEEAAEGKGYVSAPRKDLYPFDRHDREALSARMRQEHEMNKRMGLIGHGSPTNQLPYERALAVMKGREEEVERKQAMLRNGGQHQHMGKEDFQKMMTGGRSFGMKGSGFPGKANSALAQVQARAAREKGGQ